MGWLRKCRKFFEINLISIQQWVEITSIYLKRKTQIWFEGYICNIERMINQDEFSRAVCNRFGSRDDMVQEFNELVQEGNVYEYVVKIEN